MDVERYAPIYARAEPYWQTRSNEIHVPDSYRFAQALLDEHPEADPDVVLPAILLHDVGYMVVPHDDHLKGLAGGAQGWEPDITRRHEIQGAALAREILTEVGWDEPRIAMICDIVDGHDSRRHAVSVDDELVKDADKLWRYTESAVRICHEWMKLTTDAYMDWVGSEIDNWLFTGTARRIARNVLDDSRRALAADPVA